MAKLLLGPVLRYVDARSATVWAETDEPCTVRVRGAAPPEGAGGGTAEGHAAPAPASFSGEAATFRVAGHHYALVVLDGLPPGAALPYEVTVEADGGGGEARVWPEEGSAFPPSEIRTPSEDPAAPVRVSFGSCRWAAPPAEEKDPVGPDALDTLARRLAGEPASERPGLLVLLGDQVYADEVSPATREWMGRRRDLDRPPGAQVADYAEYTRLYAESWGDPEIRWLLSTVPSVMIFDDHDVIDDWNTSDTWLAEMRATDWWRERILSGLMSYWVHQHLGNLSPADLAADPLLAAIRAAPGRDGTEALRAFAERADADPAAVRWSYRRDLGRTRLVMIDSRAARVLAEDRRAMLDPEEEDWLGAQVREDRGAYDHLLLGTSLPWLLPHLIHDLESWDSALCGGERGARWAGRGEYLRRAADLEHWAAFPRSFGALADLIAEVREGPEAPATVSVLSGDVHHAYVAEARWPREGAAGWPREDEAVPGSPVYQLTCSPVHNSVPLAMRFGFRFGWTGAGRALGGLFARHGRVRRPAVRWRRDGGPWFGNQLMTLDLRGRTAELTLEKAVVRGGRAALREVTRTRLHRA
ncbi:alkaline phosphatase D family protein [Streptomyces sp. SID11385]|uniref:alkaline phosphatase D family protein n=1 Tax=Streptomyces sp. SID11385 TaxID=2706031 RepID=UPI0013CC31E9|nr:alkaline phosphatase D family protein [Streptomyces sp. SID11385]NEA38986.1 alkaline phosphatase family protein [Streptomyces sp. SID11385]